MSKQTWCVTLVGALVAVGLGYVGLITRSEQTPVVQNSEIALVLAAILILLGILFVLIQISRDQPKIVVTDYVIELVSIQNQPTGDVQFMPSGTTANTTFSSLYTASGPTGPSASPGPARNGLNFYATYLHAGNCPAIGSKTAKDVHVRLRYLTPDDRTEIQQVNARWSFTEQNSLYETTQIAPEIDIPANNDSPRKFDVLATFDGDDQIYAVDDTSRFRGWKAKPLGPGPIIVEVTVLGSNIKKTIYEFITRRNSSGKGIELVPHSKP